MFGLETPKFRDAFETEILGNLTRRYGSISNADADALEKECLYYATDMCLEFQAKSGGFLLKIGETIYLMKYVLCSTSIFLGNTIKPYVKYNILL